LLGLTGLQAVVWFYILAIIVMIIMGFVKNKDDEIENYL